MARLNFRTHLAAVKQLCLLFARGAEVRGWIRWSTKPIHESQTTDGEGVILMASVSTGSHLT